MSTGTLGDVAAVAGPMAPLRTGRRLGRAGGLARQLGSVAITLVGLLLLTFLIGRVIPVDPVLLILGDKADQAAYERIYRELGLHLPLWQQFLDYCWDMVRGDFGNSIITSNRVIDDILTVFPATVELATAALLVAIGVGVPLGVLAALHQNGWIDHVARVVGLLGHSAPGFWLALMALLVFYAMLGWAAGPGRLDISYLYTFEQRTGLLFLDAVLARDWAVLKDAFAHIVLPASVMGYAAAAYISRMTRSFMLEQLGQDYVTTARIKGLRTRAVIWRHAFLGIRVQLLTVIVLSYGFLLDGSVLIETIFSWPGFGRYTVSAMMAGDMNAVLASVLLVGVSYIGLNLLSDLLYRYLDPRTR